MALEIPVGAIEGGSRSEGEVGAPVLNAVAALGESFDGGTSSDAVAATEAGAGAYLDGVARSLDTFMATFDAACFTGPDAGRMVARFARIERLACAGKTFAAHRSAEAEIHRDSGHHDPARWLAEQTGETVGQAADTLALGRALASQPGVEDAFRRGKLSDPKVKLISRAVTANPGSESDLLGSADQATVRQVQDRCARAKAQARSADEEAKRQEALRSRRSCRTWIDREDGAFCMSARLTPDAGARVLSVLEATTDKMFNAARAAGRRDSHDNYAADALVAIITGSTDHLVDPEDPDGGEDGTARRRTSRSSRARVHVRIDLDALRQGSVGPGQMCEIPGVGPISVQTAKEIMGDAITTLFITNGIDVPAICNLGRHIPAAISAALLERDPICVVPGCDRSDHLQVDHCHLDYAKGGATEWWNLVRICQHHHLLKTTKRFRLEGRPGEWRFVPNKSGPSGSDPDDGDGPPEALAVDD
ncbi:MAG: hypothetical protein WCI26_07925 [Acidimicrobiales bacterium]